MSKVKQSELERLAQFLYNDNAEFDSSDDSLRKFDSNLRELLGRATKASKQGWLANAQAKRRQFESSAQGLIGQLAQKFGSREELIKAIQQGALGGDAKSRYALQFRNRRVDELSNEDLKSILSDQELLEILRKMNGDSK